MGYKRNDSGKIIDGNNTEIFSNDIYNQLLAGEHTYIFSPNDNYVSMQTEKVFIPFADDARKYVELVCSNLMDNNGSLASDDNEKKLYTKDVKSFMAIVNKICDTAQDDVKNKILGGVFPTKDDVDAKYQVPLYLCAEILKAKWNKEYQNSPSETWETYNSDDAATVAKDSTLGAQMDVIVEKLKTLDYDKEYFNGDMSQESSDYVAACQFDPTNSIDIYAQCEEESCDLYATNGVQTYNITMFKVEKKKEEAPAPVIAPPAGIAPVENASSILPATAPVNIITDSNDVAQIGDKVEKDEIKPATSIFATNDTPIAPTSIINDNEEKKESTPEEKDSSNDSFKSKYEKFVKLRAELIKVQEEFNKAADELESAAELEESVKSKAA